MPGGDQIIVMDSNKMIEDDDFRKKIEELDIIKNTDEVTGTPSREKVNAWLAFHAIG